MSEAEAQFISLGNHLKYVREQAKESLAEVSGAVEIDENYLERIEAGLERPAEDVLLLLISHFGVKDHEAVQLWESADYDSALPDEIRPEHELIQLASEKPLVMLVAGDSRAVYSDAVEIFATPSGVTITFAHTQKGGKFAPVAKVGMGPQQAELLLASLQKAILHAKYGGTKLLPPASPTQDTV